MIPAPPARDPRKEAILHTLAILVALLVAIGLVAWWVTP